MDPARWRRIRELLETVGDLPAGDREAALARACPGDPALADEVRSLLAQHTGVGDRAEAIVAGAALELAQSDAAGDAGQRVGPYRLVREIGRGGMGAVYLAERVDGQFDQQVALKRVTPGLRSETFLRRFRAERQILARLQHPQIARLLDGGVDDTGQPYFAMEYVDGIPIDRYAAEHDLSIDDRLALVQEACRAVTYAHANLVVHRDLKPAHILVTPDGHVRLIDFGIAAVVSEDEPGGALTQFGLRALTPDYASPEQVRGEPVGTASDVYSLGVILYQLLTDVRPYSVDSRTPAEVERIVCDTEPPRPSTLGDRVERIDADLDVICLKALQKDPARRYLSVEALHEDIRRHRAGLPVLARPDSVGYRLGKFMSRHRAGVAMTAATALVVLSLTAFYTVRLARERDRAQVEAARAAQVAGFLEGLFEVSDPSESRGRTITARELLDEGAARIEDELAEQPAVRASMMRLMGSVYGKLGLFDTARPLLERAVEESRRIHGPEHEETAESEMVLASIRQDMSDLDGAERLFRHALEVRQRVYGRVHPAVSDSLEQLGYFLETKGDADGAEELARQVLEIDRALYAPGDPRLAESLANLAGLLRRLQKFDAAEPALREALAALRAAYGDKDLEVASTARNLASLLRDRGEHEEAEELFLEVIATRREILGPEHPELGVALNSYANLLSQRGDDARAVDIYREFLGILERTHDNQPHPDIAAVYSNLAISLRSLGRLDEAETAYRTSLTMADEVLPPGHPNRAFARDGLASVYMDRGQFAEAERLLRNALGIRRAALPAGHRYIGDTLVDLGTCLTAVERYDEAERLLREAHELYLAAVGPDDHRTKRAEARLVELEAARAGG